MAMSTRNAGALVNGAPTGETRVPVRLLVDTFIKGFGDCEAGDEVEVSVSDYHFLIGYKMAEAIAE